MASIFRYLRANLAVKFDVPKSSKFASKYRKNSTRDKFASRLRGYALNLCGQGLLVARFFFVGRICEPPKDVFDAFFGLA
ncbi:hypothetical protein [Campylobacter rectus]|uniref:Uncharacterized protein n=1 Tax=Campylobacter rectus TaxID=203 RepID=A0A6G5QJP0_CAMRE|nr:hypothetical protein [Campylobacter rectus]QCD45880.1 hypothetical protein CRECT_0178 [Campylobacter rectus]UEB48859.1 hypothetical protein LK437_06085 [Campylobacter rectus]